MKKRQVKIGYIVICCFLLFSCSKKSSVRDLTSITDMEGTVVSIPEQINRVACISPSATDLMIAFGLGYKIYGTYRSFTYNTWAQELYPPAKDFKAYSYSVSAEELLSDKIDLVIIQDTENAQTFRNAGIPVVAVHQYSPSGKFDDEVYDVARILSSIFPECKKKADSWIKDVQKTIADIESNTNKTKDKNLVYYVNGEKAKGLYYSDGGNSMISRILEVSGTLLATEKYEVLNVHKVSDEEMVSLNPYAMIIGGAYQNNLIDSLNKSPVWSELKCNKEGRVYRIPVCMVGIENVSAETPLMLKYTASLFSDYKFDMNIEMKTCIKKYFGYELSDSDVQNMCNGLDKNGNRMVYAK